MEYTRFSVYVLALFSLFATGSFGEDVCFDEECLPTVVKHLEGARKRHDAAVFDINQPEIIEAIKNGHWRGVKQRILTDSRQAGGKYSRVLDLYLLGVNIRLNSRKSLQHNKFSIVDGKESVAGSFNWTNGASRRNSEDLTRTRKGLFSWGANGVVDEYQDKFEEKWEANSQEKSDKKFEARIEKNREALLGRWKQWIVDTLDYESIWGRHASAKVASAINMVNKLKYSPPRVIRGLQKVARGKFAKDVRAEALRALGSSGTTSLGAHRTIAELARYGPRPVREAAKEAMEQLGPRFRINPETYWSGALGSIRRVRARCGQAWRLLSPW